MVIVSILIVSTLLIVVTPVFAGQWFMKKKFRADQSASVAEYPMDEG